MLLKTLLNKIEKYSSFVYKKIHLDVIILQEILIIEIVSRVGSKGRCPECNRRCPTSLLQNRVLKEDAFSKTRNYFPQCLSSHNGHPPALKVIHEPFGNIPSRKL